MVERGSDLCVLAVDPGVKTGVAWCRVGGAVLDAVGVASVVKARLLAKRGGGGEWVGGCGEVDARRLGETWAVHRLMTAVLNVKPDVVVIEDFVLRSPSMNRDLLAPVRMTAMLLYGLSMAWPVAQVVLQGASAAKTTCTDSRMRAWGLWQVGKPHATDALRHLVLYLRTVS